MTTGSQAEFSRWYGCSRSSVTEFAQNGRVVWAGDKVLDFEATKKKIEDTTDRIDMVEIAAAKKGVAPPTQNRSGEVYQQSKAQEKYYKALQAKADYERSIGEMVAIEEIKTLHASIGIILRESFERMPDFLGEELFAANSSEELKGILAAHIDELLNQAADNLDKYTKKR